MQPMIRWYVTIRHGGAVGGPYKSEEIANGHLTTLAKSEKYYDYPLIVVERDIHQLKARKRVLSYAISK